MTTHDGVEVKPEQLLYVVSLHTENLDIVARVTIGRVWQSPTSKMFHISFINQNTSHWASERIHQQKWCSTVEAAKTLAIREATINYTKSIIAIEGIK